MSKQLFFFFEAKWIISGVFDSVLLIKTLVAYTRVLYSNERPYIFLTIFDSFTLYDVIGVFRVLLLELNFSWIICVMSLSMGMRII